MVREQTFDAGESDEHRVSSSPFDRRGDAVVASSCNSSAFSRRFASSSRRTSSPCYELRAFDLLNDVPQIVEAAFLGVQVTTALQVGDLATRRGERRMRLSRRAFGPAPVEPLGERGR